MIRQCCLCNCCWAEMKPCTSFLLLLGSWKGSCSQKDMIPLPLFVCIFGCAHTLYMSGCVGMHMPSFVYVCVYLQKKK